MVRWTSAVTAALFLAGAAPVARAQDPPTTPPDREVASEDVEPLVVGDPGTMTLGIAGFVDRFYSSEKYLPTHFVVEVDLQRFLTRHLAVRGGIVGAGSAGGEDEDKGTAGTGMAALHAGGGVAYFLTPQSMTSLYGGVEYWAQVTNRGEGGDSGSVLAKLGWQASVSSRAGFFVEAGAGIGLTRASDDSMRTRFQGRVGLRIRL